MPKKKKGRPKTPASKSLSPGFSVRMISAEVKEVEDAIEASGKRKSSWIRDTLLDAARAQTASQALSRLGGSMPKL